MTETKTVRIPERYPAFSKPVLCVCLARAKAKPYRFENETVTELPLMQTPDTEYHYTDLEGLSPSPQGGGLGFRPGTDEHNKEHYSHVFMNYFVHALTEMDKKTPYERIILFAPKAMKNLALTKLNNEMREKTVIIPGNFFKASPLELLEKFHSGN